MGEGCTGFSVKQMQVGSRDIQLHSASRLQRQAIMGHGHDGAAKPKLKRLLKLLKRWAEALKLRRNI